MEKIEIVVRFTKDNGKSHEQTIFEWSEKSYVDQKILYFPGLEIHLARVYLKTQKRPKKC